MSQKERHWVIRREYEESIEIKGFGGNIGV